MAHPKVLFSDCAALLIIAIASLFTLHGCSVKEDRGLCPCRVCFDYSLLLSDKQVGSIVHKCIETTIFSEDGGVLYRLVSDGDTCSRREIEISRNRYSATTLVYDRVSHYYEGDLSSTIAGAEPLFGESAPLEATGESATVIPAPYKQFITVTVHFSQPASNLTVDLTAPSTGMDRLTLEGNEEPCGLSAAVDGETVSFRLLRQAGNDISLTFTQSTGGRVIAQVGLGSLLTKSGFDFRAKSLNDIDIYADLKGGSLVIGVLDWRSEPVSIIF